MQTLKTKTLSWHHFLRPTVADVSWLKNHYAFHQLVLEELATPTARPRVDTFDDYLYIVLHFPLFDEKTRKTHSAEVDFIIAKKELITVTYEDIGPLDDAFRKCSTDRSSEEFYASKTPAHLFFHVLKDLYAFALRELDHIQENINRIEEKVFAAPHESELVEKLAAVRRDVIDFRRAMKPQQQTLETLVGHGTALFGRPLRPFFEGLLAEYRKIWNLLENNKEAVDALYENHVSVLNIKQNEAVKILTIMAFTTFPLMLVAALFSMDTIHTPIVGYPYDFWYIIGIMAAATFGMFLFFKRKHWL